MQPSQPGQLSLASLHRRQIEYQLELAAGCQWHITLMCDPKMA